MRNKEPTETSAGLGWIERLLPLNIVIFIFLGVLLGRYLPEITKYLEIGIPIGLFLMIYPEMMTIKVEEFPQALLEIPVLYEVPNPTFKGKNSDLI